MKKLSSKGLADKDVLVLKSLIDLMTSRTRNVWTYAESALSDAVIIDTDNTQDSGALIDEVEAQNAVTIEFCNNAGSGRARFSIQKPLRAAKLISVFEAIDGRKEITSAPGANAYNAVSPLPGTAPERRRYHDAPTLASTGHSPCFTLSANNTECLVDSTRGRYRVLGDLTLDDLLARPELTIKPATVPDPSDSDEWQTTPSLQWKIGVRLSGGELIRELPPGAHFKLLRWPPSDLALMSPKIMTLCALFSRKSGATVDEATTKSNISTADVIGFINGAYLANALSIQSVGSVEHETDSVVPDQPKRLFHMIRERLRRKPK